MMGRALGVTALLALFALPGCGHKDPPSGASENAPYEVHCTEPLPVFTLGEHSNPSKEQVTALCSCIWQNLEGWARDTSVKIAQGKEADVSALHIRAFPARFGEKIEECGGMKL